MNENDNPSALKEDNMEDDIVSKTQLKKDALALKKFGLELAQLPADKVEKLPLDETTIKSILDYQKITTNLARKRQLMFVGKCLRHENESEIRQYLNEQANSHLKAKVIKQDPIQDIVDNLLETKEAAIEDLLQVHPNLERQTLRQMLRNISNAKNPSKSSQAISKLKQHLQKLISLKSN
jgi:ribosome-associated protein